MEANVLRLFKDYITEHGVKEAHSKAMCLLSSIVPNGNNNPLRKDVIKAKAASDMLWYLFEDKDIDDEYVKFMEQWLSK